MGYLRTTPHKTSLRYAQPQVSCSSQKGDRKKILKRERNLFTAVGRAMKSSLQQESIATVQKYSGRSEF